METRPILTDARIRLFVEQPLAPGNPVRLTDAQTHYLTAVMRLGVGDAVRLFNGTDGEWRAEVADTARRGATLVCGARTRLQEAACDLWLLFAPIKKARTDFIVEKAVEMGVARILPVQTRHTQADRIRQDRLQAHAMEAAEQCGALAVARVEPLAPLDRVLAGWPSGRRILWADEDLRDGGDPGQGGAASPEPSVDAGGWAVLVGPEGGFSTEEQARLRAMPQVMPVRLGPRILRADTAAVAALTLWQLRYGDWGAGADDA